MSPFTHITCVLTIPPLSLERFLRALRNAPSQAMVLILPPVKLNSQRLSHCAFFSHHPWLTLSNVKRTNQCNANQFSRSQSPSTRQENFQSVFHQRRGQRIKLESKRGKPQPSLCHGQSQCTWEGHLCYWPKTAQPASVGALFP